MEQSKVEDTLLNTNTTMTANMITIPCFFEGKSVFITGATGFIGKILVEKLLRSCPGVQKIFILIRDKRGNDHKQRLNHLLNSSVFGLIKKSDPKALEKIVGIIGDLSQPGLGMSQEDLKKMTESVSVVFHCAATISFNAPIKEAVNLNVVATKRLLDLCHCLPNLEAVIHLSTAYSNCNRKETDEKVYSSPYTVNQVIDITKWLDENALESVTSKLIGSHPNTYTFTKGLAETLLEEEGTSLPLAIIRPSIVSAAWKEPYAGWIDNTNGVTGVIICAGKGISRTMHMRRNDAANIVPVDVVANLMLAVSWYTAVYSPHKLLVYNCVAESTNKLTWGDVVSKTNCMMYDYPSHDLYRYPSFRMCGNQMVNNAFVFLEHYLPAFLTDCMTQLFSQKPKRMLRVYQKLHKATDFLQFFTTKEWIFHHKNFNWLRDIMTPEDKKVFYLDTSNINWNYFWENHFIGCRKFILKEDLSNILAARKNLTKRYFLSKALRILLALAVWKIFFSTL